nr:site-specific integrase [uncultured Duncaniella sp.]
MAESLNEQIRRVADGIREKMSSIAAHGGEYDLSLLKKVRKTRVQSSTMDFLAWLEERIDMRPVSESTRRQHKVMLSCLREFGEIRNFCDLTPKNIRLWDDFIRKRVKAQSSVHGYHKRLKPYIIEAIQFEKLESNPYENMRIPRGKSEGIKFLTEEERDRVEALELYGMTEQVRDMFIFSCYTGLAYSDLVKIKKSDVFKQGEDMCIRDKRVKTGQPYTIVLLPKAAAILRKYDYNLNLMSNQKCNDQLKLIANMAGIHLNLTMHVGRHTFATWALTKGVDISTVSKMLAHSSVAMTEKYAQVLQTSVIKGYGILK